MKLLIVNTVPSRRNGISNVIFNLLGVLEPGKIEIGYVAMSEIDEDYLAILGKLKAEVYVLSRKMSSPIGYVANLAMIAEGYDVLHAHGNSATMALEMAAARIAGVHVRAAHSHNTSCSMKAIHLFANPLFQRLCNLRLACSDSAGKWLFGNRDFNIINNSIDANRFAFSSATRKGMRKKLNLSDKIVIGHIGYFVTAKNHPFLLEIFRSVLDRVSNAHLMLLGNGSLMKDIEEKVSALGVSEHVSFAGNVPDPYNYTSAMDVCVMPSSHEGFPLTLLEQQAAGLVTIASANITADTNLTGNVKFMSLSKSAEEWADAIIGEIDDDDVMRESRSRTAIEIIKAREYDSESSSGKLLSAFEDAIKNIR